MRHLVLLGGGGFSMEPDNPLLDDYTLRLTRKRRPRVCFLPTASGDALGYIENFRRAFPPSRARASFVSLFKRSAHDLEARLLDQDVLYVGGGSTANLLALWRLHGVDRVLKKAWSRGVVLTGVSAGMLCWFESCLTDSFGPLSPLHDGLGFLKGSACPHYDGEPGRRPAYHRLVAAGALPAGYAVEDSAALHFVGRRLHRAICSVPGKRAFSVRAAPGSATGCLETPISMTQLRRRSSRPSSPAGPL